MRQMLYLSLLNNTTLLVSLTLIHALLNRFFDKDTLRHKVLSGLLFGAVAIIGMKNSVMVMEGIMFDGRSIVLTTAGMFGGPMVAGVSVVISAVYRIIVGGEGTLMGVLVIAESAIIGTLMWYLRRRYSFAGNWLSILAAGILVHAIMLLLTWALPSEERGNILSQIMLPVIVIYPIAFLLIALFFEGSERYSETVKMLRDSEEKYRLLVHNQRDMVVKVDQNGRFLYVSPSYCDMFGMKEEDLLGKEFMPLVHEDDKESTSRAMRDLMRPPHNVYIEQRAMTRFGWMWLSWSDTAVVDDQGNVREIIGVGRNIEEKKRSEQELVKAMKRAEHSDRLKTAFLNNLSHEIRTPLNAIAGFSALLASGEHSIDENRRFSEIVTRSSDQLIALINDILDLSAIEAGEVTINYEKSDIGVIVDQVFQMHRFRAGDNGVALKVAMMPPAGERTILTDRVRLVQVLSNLVGNAIKFAPGGEVKVSCDFQGESVLFSVKDNGIGIPEEAHGYIFERFRRADTSPPFIRGTGLGLAISKSFVTLMGGEIWVESEPGRGATFFFSLPVPAYDTDD